MYDKDGEPQRLNVGYIVWIPAGRESWYGADEGYHLLQIAISHGKTTWYDAVPDEEYNRNSKST